MSDPQWQSDIDAAFKTAPLALQDNRTDAQKNQTQVFLLKNLDYYNLQKYLHVGTGLPQDDSHFKGLFPPNNLQKLTAIDASIYNQLSQWFSTVAGNCLKFDSNTMPKFVTITGAIVNYCDDMNRYMSGPGLLQDQIKILKTDGNTPDTDSWKTACGKIKVILKILSGRAGNRIADIKALIAELKAFQDLTIADQKNIGYLERQFITGPVQKNFTDPTPATDKRTYTTRLNAALGDLSAEVNKLQKDIHNEEDERQDDIVKAATAVTYVWIVPVGTIAAGAVMGVYGARAEELRKKIEANKAKLADDQAQATALQNCIDMVHSIVCDIQDINDAIGGAIQALTDLQASFGQQQIDFANLSGQFGALQQGTVDAQAAEEIPIYMDPAVDSAVSSWAEIKQLALDFQTNAAIQYTPA